MSNLQTALEALENRNDRENKANCKLARMMQVKDKKYVDEHKYMLFRQKQKETGAVTHIKEREGADQAVQPNNVSALIEKSIKNDSKVQKQHE